MLNSTGHGWQECGPAFLLIPERRCQAASASLCRYGGSSYDDCLYSEKTEMHIHQQGGMVVVIALNRSGMSLAGLAAMQRISDAPSPLFRRKQSSRVVQCLRTTSKRASHCATIKIGGMFAALHQCRIAPFGTDLAFRRRTWH